MATDLIHFEDTPLSRALEDGYKHSLVLRDPDQMERDRILAALRPISPQFHWKAAKLRDGDVIVDGPGWWKEKALRKESVKVEDQWLEVRSWNDYIEGGFKLKSVWVRVVDFPRKFWSPEEFVKLVKGFGVILEIDRNTLERIDLHEAKLRLGVPDPRRIPAFKEIVFPVGDEKRWKRVKFILETPIDLPPVKNKRRKVWMKKTGTKNSEPSSSQANPVPEDGDDDEELVDYDGEDWGEGEAQADDESHVDPESGSDYTVPDLTEDEAARVENGVKDTDSTSLVIFQPVEMQHSTSSVTRDNNHQNKTEISQKVVVPHVANLFSEQNKEVHIEAVTSNTGERSLVVQPLNQAPPSPRLTRQSIRQKILGGDQPVQGKAQQRKKILNLEAAEPGLLGYWSGAWNEQLTTQVMAMLPDVGEIPLLLKGGADATTVVA